MSLENLVESCSYLSYPELAQSLVPRRPTLRLALAAATLFLLVRSLLCL